MARTLPPLNALRAFEAAARHLSFTLAAEELHVTQAAVSHQVKALEERLGVKLFRRLPRALFLTEEGQALAPDLREGFDRLAEAVGRVGRREAHGTLTVTLLTTFALGWLVPRLSAFQAIHPEIDVKMMTSARLVDFTREDVDCGIRNGTGQWPELYRLKLLDEFFSPLCTPEMAARLRQPDDLAQVSLLQTIGLPNEWQVWFDGAGLRPGFDVTRGPMFDSTLIAVQAAMRGLGVAVGDPRHFAADIAAGRLVIPFPQVVPMGKSWWFVCLPSMAERSKIKAFREWLVAEMERFLAQPGMSELAHGASNPT